MAKFRRPPMSANGSSANGSGGLWSSMAESMGSKAASLLTAAKEVAATQVAVAATQVVAGRALSQVERLVEADPAVCCKTLRHRDASCAAWIEALPSPIGARWLSAPGMNSSGKKWLDWRRS